MKAFLAVIAATAFLAAEVRASDVAESQDEMTLLRKQIAALEERVAELERILALSRPRETADMPAAVVRPVAPARALDGRVAAATGGNLLVTLGRSDGVREGMRFRIFHGAQWIGDVRVTRVYGSQAAGEAAQVTTTPFRVGDAVRRGSETGNF